MVKLFAVQTRREYFEKIAVQQEQADEFYELLLCYKITNGMFTIVGDDNKVYGIFEAAQFWKDRICIKAIISKDCGSVMFKMISKLKEVYKLNAPARLEAEVLNSFENGKRFLRLFGFRQESVMKQYYNGKDYCLFVLLKKDNG